MVLPCEDQILRNQVLGRPANNVTNLDRLPKEVELGICAIMEKEIDFSNKLEILKRSLQACPDYNALSGFRTIEKFSSVGVIDCYNLAPFMR